MSDDHMSYQEHLSFSKHIAQMELELSYKISSSILSCAKEELAFWNPYSSKDILDSIRKAALNDLLTMTLIDMHRFFCYVR